MTPRERVRTVNASDRAIDVLRIVSDEGLNQVPVIEGGQVVGMISRRELLARVELERAFGPQRDPAGA
jgi:predicted transcriptional regulator